MIRALALRALRAWEPSPAVWDRFLSLLFPRLFWPGHIQQRLLARVFHCAASDQLSKNLKGLCGSKSERRCPALLLSYPLELLSWPPLFEKLEILEISCRDLQDKLRSTELKSQTFSHCSTHFTNILIIIFQDLLCDKKDEEK